MGLVAYGDDLPTAFANAGLGLFDLMVETECPSEEVVRRIEAAGADLPDLLVAWLNELLYLFEVEGLVFSRFEVEVRGSTRLRATGYGGRFDPGRDTVKIGVKAATYHRAAVEQVAGPSGPRWRAQVVLDV